MTGNLVRPLPWPPRAIAAAGFSAAGSLLGFALLPWIAALGVVSLAMGGFAAALVLLGFGWWFALAVPFAAMIPSLVLAYVVRFLVEERGSAAGCRMPSAIIWSRRSSNSWPTAKQNCVLAASCARSRSCSPICPAFTALSGKIGPSELMTVTTDYLGIIVAAVEASGGYVDKFIGDAVMGIWGAPAANPDHAAAAARTALQAVDEVSKAKAAADARGEHGYSLKIGINSGPAVVGNVGAPQRYNYTAVGETVNIAARLEGVPGDYGCNIVVGPATAKAIEDRFLVCELDLIKVKGKTEAFPVYELLGEKTAEDRAGLAYLAQYGAALACYRAGQPPPNGGTCPPWSWPAAAPN
jgi:class 3 adenylate cyclase